MNGLFRPKVPEFQILSVCFSVPDFPDFHIQNPRDDVRYLRREVQMRMQKDAVEREANYRSNAPSFLRLNLRLFAANF